MSRMKGRELKSTTKGSKKMNIHKPVRYAGYVNIHNIVLVTYELAGGDYCDRSTQSIITITIEKYIQT